MGSNSALSKDSPAVIATTASVNGFDTQPPIESTQGITVREGELRTTSQVENTHYIPSAVGGVKDNATTLQAPLALPNDGGFAKLGTTNYLVRPLASSFHIPGSPTPPVYDAFNTTSPLSPVGAAQPAAQGVLHPDHGPSLLKYGGEGAVPFFFNAPKHIDPQQPNRLSAELLRRPTSIETAKYSPSRPIALLQSQSPRAPRAGPAPDSSYSGSSELSSEHLPWSSASISDCKSYLKASRTVGVTVNPVNFISGELMSLADRFEADQTRLDRLEQKLDSVLEMYYFAPLIEINAVF
jgi:hypothetical protein